MDTYFPSFHIFNRSAIGVLGAILVRDKEDEE